MLVNGKTMVRTRFAPSPTGYLHIGGVRTALFNYLFARHYEGSFVLRIDDTDSERNIAATVKPILNGLRWIGIHWDDGPIYQSSRKEHYQQLAIELIKKGYAYPDYGQGDGKTAYRGINRNMQPEVAYNLYDDTGWAIRFKIPDGKVILDDLIRGSITWENQLISDPVIVRPNGDPTYNFTSAIDDGEMKITHVIRGEEHLSNTPIQLMIAEALDYVPPFYAHLPYVCEPNSNKKLSKRDCVKFITDEVMDSMLQIGFTHDEVTKREDLSPVSLSYYQAMGYKPEGVANYLARLGWSLDDRTEILSMKELEKHFDLKRVKTSPARFDPKKMLWVNSEHVKKENIDLKTLDCIRLLQNAKILPKSIKPEIIEKTRKVIITCGERIKCYADIIKYGSFFYKKPIHNTAAMWQHLNRENTILLDEILEKLKTIIDWNANNIEQEVTNYLTNKNIKTTIIIPPLRVCLTGKNVSPHIYESMEILGKQECIDRIHSAMSMTSTTGMTWMGT